MRSVNIIKKAIYFLYLKKGLNQERQNWELNDSGKVKVFLFILLSSIFGQRCLTKGPNHTCIFLRPQWGFSSRVCGFWADRERWHLSEASPDFACLQHSTTPLFSSQKKIPRFIFYDSKPLMFWDTQQLNALAYSHNSIKNGCINSHSFRLWLCNVRQFKIDTKSFFKLFEWTHCCVWRHELWSQTDEHPEPEMRDSAHHSG